LAGALFTAEVLAGAALAAALFAARDFAAGALAGAALAAALFAARDFAAGALAGAALTAAPFGAAVAFAVAFAAAVLAVGTWVSVFFAAAFLAAVFFAAEVFAEARAFVAATARWAVAESSVTWIPCCSNERNTTFIRLGLISACTNATRSCSLSTEPWVVPIRTSF
jgi:hypothetical protein